jgi:hypothetical protein
MVTPPWLKKSGEQWPVISDQEGDNKQKLPDQIQQLVVCAPTLI